MSGPVLILPFLPFVLAFTVTTGNYAAGARAYFPTLEACEDAKFRAIEISKTDQRPRFSNLACSERPAVVRRRWI